MKIDAHQHFWIFDPIRDAWIDKTTMSAIRRDFMPVDLALLLSQNNFHGCIAVQADQSEKETEFLLDLAFKNDFIKGVVGWIDIRSKNLSDYLDKWMTHSKLKGFRHILQGEKPEFMLQPDFIKGISLLGKRGYTYDILVFPKHLKAVKSFLQHFDHQPFVLDHLAKPYIKKGLIKQWAKVIRSIARHQNVHCKISGMVTEANWTTWKESEFTAYLDVVFEAFGTERLMYGSDWPVCLLAADYKQQLDVIYNYVMKYAPTDVNKIFGENACKFYKL